MLIASLSMLTDLSEFLSFSSRMFYIQETILLIPYTLQCFVLFLGSGISLYLFGKLIFQYCNDDKNLGLS